MYTKDLKHFKEFFPNEEKLRQLYGALLTGHLNLPDFRRNPLSINYSIALLLSSPNVIAYEVGDFDGLLGFVDIIPFYQSALFFKIINKEGDFWSTDFAREAKALTERVMEHFNLLKVVTCTPDERMAKIGKTMGFNVNNTFDKAFIHAGKAYDLHYLIKEREI